MVYLIFSIVFSTSILLLFKWYGKLKANILLALAVNYFTAALLSIGFINELPSFSYWMGTAAFLGFMFMVVFWLMAYSTQLSGVAVTTLAAKLSMVFPILIGVVMYKEWPLSAQWIGIALSFSAIFFTTERKGVKSKARWMPLLVFLGAGFTDTLIGFHSRIVPPEHQYLLYALVFGFAGLTGLFFLFRSKTKIQKPQLKLGLWTGLLLGLVNFGSLFFIFRSIKHGFPQSIFFPSNNIGIIVFAALGGLLLFKEYPKKATWIGLALGVAGLLWLLLPSYFAKN